MKPLSIQNVRAERVTQARQLRQVLETGDYRSINMSRPRIPIYFDYASTLCYIAWRIVTPLEDELGFEALWKGVPIATRDFRAKPGRVLGERERQKVLFVAAETGVRVAPPSSWIDSIPALHGSEVARDAGVFRAYHDAVFRAAFDDGADIADRKVLDAIAERSGIDRSKFRAALERGPRLSSVSEVREESAVIDPQYANEFVTTYDAP